MTYSDAELAQWIQDTMLMDPRVSAQRVQVSAEDGVVTIKGTVQSRERKHIVLAIAATHPSCRGIVDKLRVAPPGRLSDDEIARNARAVLDTLVESVQEAVTLSASAGVVTLRGTVPTEWEQTVAADLVMGAVGVREVRNKLDTIGCYDV